ncbi:GNAT family N-acetyltransferase [Mycobacterium sp. ITM-2016-00318]|uniref:GNAT family N-acetyltransferase n=1 Tax=Mycobacterium sp. ITM-2016-00318 TaxID=2099693 RepID=UPI000CF920F3|nr:GNAT family N-acetyltransferase [Mycobacterium sp. ITM-2016-00318]WNG93497.1 GNAT family N-acetyltransferase [Mycobacterium sp. ITM-2016-00318]
MTEPLFCSIELGQRIERAEAQLIAAGTEAAIRRNPGRPFVTPIAGGFACFGDDGAPFNKVVGLGFGGVPSEASLDDIESAYAARGAAVQVELAHLADPEVGIVLTGRGYRLVAFENVLGRPLRGGEASQGHAEVQVRQCDEDELDAWLDVVVSGFANPDDQGVATHEDFPREIVERAERDLVAAGALTYLARREGVVAGGGGLRVTDGVAQLVGAATAPEHRRRGVQSALLATRLVDAARAGCDIAVVTTAPGSKSQQNVQRQGFHLLYTRAVLVKVTE